MAKLGLLFIVIFCIIQFTLAARLRRDAFDEAVDTVKKGISDTFTKENVDNFLGKLTELGDTIKAKASEIGQTLQDKAQEALIPEEDPTIGDEDGMEGLVYGECFLAPWTCLFSDGLLAGWLVL